MSDTDEEKSWCPSNVPPSPSKARVLPMKSAEEFLERRHKFWAAHEALQSLKVEVELDNLTEIQPIQLEQAAPVIHLTHPGPPRRCLVDRREPDFDPVVFVLDRCRADPVLEKKFLQTDRKQFLSVLHRGFSLEGFQCWSLEERVALAGHVLLLSAIASRELDAAACERHLHSEHCSSRAVVDVALSWGVACEDLLPQQDSSLPGVTPARPSPWCVTRTLRALTSLLSRPIKPNYAGTESASSVSNQPELRALADVALTARALALCALDAAPTQAAEYVPVFAAILAAAQPWTKEAVTFMADALHFPDAHPHSQAWLLAHLVQEQPLRKLMAHRQLQALLTPTAGLDSTVEPKRESLETDELVMSGVDDMDILQVTEKTEAMEVEERPASCASSAFCDSDSLSANLNDGFVTLAGLVQLLDRKRLLVDKMDAYRKFVFLHVLATVVGDDPVTSTEDARELQKLTGWLGEILITQPADTSQLDAITIQSLVAAMTSRWQRATDFIADVGYNLSQSFSSQPLMA